MSRRSTASILSLAMALGLASCSNDYTVGYLYMTTAKTLPHGLINGYKIDYQNGSLIPLEDSPIDSGGRSPATLVVAPNNLFLYSVNHDDSNVVEFAIGTDGKLYPEHAYNISGSLPTAAAVDPSGKFLYVTYTYQLTASGQQLYSPANPGPGGISIFPINSDNTLGTPINANAGRNPIGIVASTLNHFVYVIEQDSATTFNLLGYSVNTASGALNPLPGVAINAGNLVSTGFSSGLDPTAILEDATSTHLYLTDGVANQIASYSIGSGGVPSLISGGTAATDVLPSGMTFDPSGKYLYVVNYTAGTIGGYTLGSAGQPVKSTVAGSVQAGIGPTCVTIIGSPSSASPSHGLYLYASNALSNNVTAEQVIPQTGALEQIQGTPFSGSTLPTCIVSAPAFPR